MPAPIAKLVGAAFTRSRDSNDLFAIARSVVSGRSKSMADARAIANATLMIRIASVSKRSLFQLMTSAANDVRGCSPLFDHLVGTREQHRWHVEAERLGGLEVEAISYLVDCCTGRSAGFSPRRMRSI